MLVLRHSVLSTLQCVMLTIHILMHMHMGRVYTYVEEHAYIRQGGEPYIFGRYIFGTQVGGALSGREQRHRTAALLSLSERLTSPQGVGLLTGGVGAAGSGLG